MEKENIQIGVISDGNTIAKIIRDMSAEEFDNMLVECGIDRIKPSSQSDYVRALRRERGAQYGQRPLGE